MITDGYYPSHDLIIKELRKSYITFASITNIIEYKNKSDYMDYILPLE